jgi:hypothetical protein
MRKQDRTQDTILHGKPMREKTPRAPTVDLHYDERLTMKGRQYALVDVYYCGLN